MARPGLVESGLVVEPGLFGPGLVVVIEPSFLFSLLRALLASRAPVTGRVYFVRIVLSKNLFVTVSENLTTGRNLFAITVSVLLRVSSCNSV